MIDPQTGKPRGRGRPRKNPITPTGSYSGPSLDTILGMTDQQVQIAFDEIGVQPTPVRWNPEDDQLNRAAWHDYGMRGHNEVVPIDQLQATAQEIHNASLRMELLRAHLQKWIESLTAGQLLDEVQRLSDTKMSVSEIRYAKEGDLRDEVAQRMWPVLIAASKLYIWPTNPLTGEVEDGRSRIAREHDS